MNNFFSHDSNARNSDKLIPLRARLGAEGYGIYFMILERLREEPTYTSVKDYNMLAFDLRVDAAKVKAVVEDFGLFVFTDDGKYFYSEGFIRRMKIKDQQSQSAQKAAEIRWAKERENKKLMRAQCERNANAVQEKESIISSPYVEDINNPPLYPPEGEEDYIPTEFVTLWDKFKGKRKSLTDDYKDFCKKTEGLVIDYVKLQRSAQFAKNVYFQTWLNDFFPKKSRRNIDLSAVEPAFQPIMADWLAYKSERGQTYRPLGLQRCYERLLRLSGNDAAKARRIVDFSIANNYSGLFPPHDQDNSANRHPATDYHAQPGQTYEDF